MSAFDRLLELQEEQTASFDRVRAGLDVAVDRLRLLEDGEGLELVLRAIAPPAPARGQRDLYTNTEEDAAAWHRAHEE